METKNYFEARNIGSSFYKKYQLPEYLKKTLPLNKESEILDIGCGLGQTLCELKKNGYKRISGVDISAHAIEQCKKKDLNVTMIESIIDYCLKNNTKYDFIIMNHVIEHIEKNKIIKTLATIKKTILNRNGCLFIAVPNAQSNTNCYWAYEDWTHTTLYTSGSLNYILKSAGFQSIEFIDIDCTAGTSYIAKVIIKSLLRIYKVNKHFWNKITNSSYHRPSIEIFSYEIKVKASN